ncbi:hypothetical protein PUN28_015346 [Cardiocondyla obscurior]|uniref:Secreted protein n=1 Tax=Cardiocondyla obscurior TaxID=286306 RepID=A0AAW2EV44_9HYME
MYIHLSIFFLFFFLAFQQLRWNYLSVSQSAFSRRPRRFLDYDVNTFRSDLARNFLTPRQGCVVGGARVTTGRNCAAG